MATFEVLVPSSWTAGEALAWLADFRNTATWDPGVEEAVALGEGPPEVGAAYRLTLRVAGRPVEMTYRVDTFEPGHRVVLTSALAGLAARDEITVEEVPAGGCVVRYRAELRPVGFARLASPLVGLGFRRFAARGATGLQAALR
jgi:hypothetical protein